MSKGILVVRRTLFIAAPHFSCMEKIKVEHHTLSGGLWFAAWLFTIGFLHLSFWKGVLAVIIWPYYLGVHFAPLFG